MKKSPGNNILESPFFPITCAVIGYGLLAVFFMLILKFDLLQSDVLGYWKDSLQWTSALSPFHVPGYPLAIALVRGLTINLLPPIAYMQIINLISLMLCMLIIVKILITEGIPHITASIGALLFALWPFVGLTNTVFPLADIPSICLFLAGLYFFLRARWIPSGILLGLSLVFHKALWPFIVLIVLFEFISKWKVLSKQHLVFFILLIIPLFILWIFGIRQFDSISWLFSTNLDVEISSRSSLPILDGLFGPFLSGGVKEIIKGIILLSFLIIAIVSLIVSIRNTEIRLKWPISISLAVFLLFVILNQHEIWAAVRFSRLLVLPLILGLSQISKLRHVNIILSKPVLIVSFSLLFASQIVYAWYMARIFFS